MSLFPCHTAYHSNFFVLRLDVRLNRLPVKLNTSPDGQLELCGQPTESHAVLHLPMETVAGAVQDCMSSAGYAIANRVMCGNDAPLFKLDIAPSCETLFLRKLVAKLPTLDKQLENILKAKFMDSAAVKEVVDCAVNAQVFFVCPETENKHADIVLVSVDNVGMCLDLWKKSAVFDFDNVFRVMMKEGIKVTPRSANAGRAVRLPELTSELKTVVEWFHFGLYLGVPDHVLAMIRHDRQTVEECKTQTLREWLKIKKGSWSDIVRALVSIRMKTLAATIAEKHGVPMPPLNETEISAVSALPFEGRSNLQSEVEKMMKQLESKVETQEDRLTEKEKKITDLTNELNSAKESLLVTRTSALFVQHKATTLEREKEQLQRDANRMDSEIQMLKEMQKMQAKSHDEARGDFQKLITEKEKLLNAVNGRLEVKEKELVEHKMEIERVGRKLEEADKEVRERHGKITELEREQAQLRADIQSERRSKDALLEKAFSSLTQATNKNQDNSATEELQAKKGEVDSLTLKLAEKDKEIAGLSQQISQLQSQISDKKDVDVLSLKLQLSELLEMMTKRETEREAVDAQLVTSSRVAKTLENLPVELDALGEKFEATLKIPPPPPPPPPFPQAKSHHEPVVVQEAVSTDDTLKSPQAFDSFATGYKLPSGVEPLVIDNGSTCIKAGFSGDNFVPHTIVPSCVCYCVGDIPSRRKAPLLNYPIERGVIVNWNDMEKIWDHTFYNELQVKPEEHPLVLVESVFSRPNGAKMMEIMFEKYKVPALNVSCSNSLHLYSMGRTTGITVSCGGGLCSILPIYEGYVVADALQQLHIGGRDLTNYLASLLVQNGHSFAETADRGESVRGIKENMCYVSLPATKSGKPKDLLTAYPLLDGTTITPDDPFTSMCPEPLFQPHLLGVDSVGIHKLIHNSINYEEHIRNDLYNDILVAGGSSMFPGFAERLRTEIAALVPHGTRVIVRADSDRLYHSWFGGNILASLPSCPWISKQEYEERGSSSRLP